MYIILLTMKVCLNFSRIFAQNANLKYILYYNFDKSIDFTIYNLRNVNFKNGTK